jgi:hypothetical protein
MTLISQRWHRNGRRDRENMIRRLKGTIRRVLKRK